MRPVIISCIIIRQVKSKQILRDDDYQDEIDFTRFLCFTAIMMSCISAGLGANFLTNCECIIIFWLKGCSEGEMQEHMHSAERYPTIRNFPIIISHFADTSYKYAVKI